MLSAFLLLVKGVSGKRVSEIEIAALTIIIDGRRFLTLGRAQPGRGLMWVERAEPRGPSNNQVIRIQSDQIIMDDQKPSLLGALRIAFIK